MSSDLQYRRAIEQALVLLRQGQSKAAQVVLENALSGVFAAIGEEPFEPLELIDIDDGPVEIPEVKSIDNDTAIAVRDEEWLVEESVKVQCISAAKLAESYGFSTYHIEESVREVLRTAVKEGKVLKR